MTLKLHLESIPMFQFLDKDDLGRINPLAKAVSKAKGEALLLHGENVPGIFIIGAGTCGVYPHGAVKPLALINVGGSFGEMSFLEKCKASATIRAETSPAKLVLFTHQDLQKLIDEDAKIGKALFRGISVTLSQKLRQTNERISQELNTYQRLFPGMSGRHGAALFLEDLERFIAKAAATSQDELEKSLKNLDQLIAADAAAGLGTAKEALIDADQRFQAFIPQLMTQLATLTNFVKGMTDLLL